MVGSLSPAQQAIFDRFDAKALSMGLTKVAQNWWWVSNYQAVLGSPVTIGCNCDPNDNKSRVNIGMLIQLPNTGKYAKMVHKTYTIDEFELVNGQDLLDISNHVHTKTQEIVALEAQLKTATAELQKYAKKAGR